MNHNDSGHSQHEAHLHQDHDPRAMAQSFLRRFFAVGILLIPLVLISTTGLGFLGIKSIPFQSYLQFVLASLIFVFGLVFFQHASEEIKSGNYGMMTLVSIALGSGYIFSAASTFLSGLEAQFYLEISTLIWVLLFGHYLEARSSFAAGDALDEVKKLLPDKVSLIKDEQIVEAKLSDLKTGDLILVRSGERVAADGKITEGSAKFNEAHITGESKPVLKEKGDKVLAGSICLDSAVRIKVGKVGANSTVGQIQSLIEQAKQTKPRAESIADQAAGLLTLISVSIAILTFGIWFFLVGQSLTFALTLAITVLVITCPHALGLAIPTVSTIATQVAVKNGLLIKDLTKLEQVRKIDYVVFDKTGTLTEGNFSAAGILNFQEAPDKSSSIKRLTKPQKKILALAASLEQQSSHVIAESVVELAKNKEISLKKVSEFKRLGGRGVTGKISGSKYWLGSQALMKDIGVWSDQAASSSEKMALGGESITFLADQQSVLGWIVLRDEIKEGVEQAVADLHQIGVKIAMLTGDSRAVAESVAKKIEIDQVFAEVLPKEKYKKIKKLQSEGYKVMMVGDGINDAAALTQADIGVAIGSGTNVAAEAGDIVLTHSQPSAVVGLFKLSQKFFQKMVQNLAWALGYNVIAIPAAAGVFIPLGFKLSPNLGAILMTLSSVIVVVNALEMKGLKLD